MEDREAFQFMALRFNVAKAKTLESDVQLIAPSPQWSQLVHVNEDYALKESDIKIPVIIAQICLGGQLSHLMIDGHHRNFRAYKEGVAVIPAKILSVKDSIEILMMPPPKLLKELCREAKKLGLLKGKR